MLPDIRVVGRTIEREIERDLHPAFAHFALQRIEIFESAERQLDCLMPAGFAPDCPRHAGIATLGDDRIIAALAIRMADGMDRREINHVKSHRFSLVKPRQTIAERRSATAASLGRTREKFIPRSELRRRTIDNHLSRGRVLCGRRAVRISGH